MPSVIGTLLMAGLGAGLYAAAIEPRRLVLRRVAVASPLWPLDRPPLRIGILSDIHAAWPHMTLARIERIVARLLAERPDLVLLPGDFVTTRTRFVRKIPVEPVAACLTPLAAAAPTLAVLGNHDWHYGAARITRALAAAGVTVLANEVCRLQLGGGSLAIAGLDDMWTGNADLEATLEELDGAVPALMLSHVPDVHPHLPAGIALTVAGHTHGGQVRLPVIGPLQTMSELPTRLTYGLNLAHGRHLYVSGGIGTTKLPIRFGRPPEIALLTLSAAPAGPGET